MLKYLWGYLPISIEAIFERDGVFAFLMSSERLFQALKEDEYSMINPRKSCGRTAVESDLAGVQFEVPFNVVFFFIVVSITYHLHKMVRGTRECVSLFPLWIITAIFSKPTFQSPPSFNFEYLYEQSIILQKCVSNFEKKKKKKKTTTNNSRLLLFFF